MKEAKRNCGIVHHIFDLEGRKDARQSDKTAQVPYLVANEPETWQDIETVLGQNAIPRVVDMLDAHGPKGDARRDYLAEFNKLLYGEDGTKPRPELDLWNMTHTYNAGTAEKPEMVPCADPALRDARAAFVQEILATLTLAGPKTYKFGTSARPLNDAEKKAANDMLPKIHGGQYNWRAITQHADSIGFALPKKAAELNAETLALYLRAKRAAEYRDPLADFAKSEPQA